MPKPIVLFLGPLTLLGLAGSPAAAEVPGPQKILSKMHAMNQMQVELAELARTKDVPRDVQAFADRLRRDHQFADVKVKDLAKFLDVQLRKPTPASPEDRQRQRALQTAKQDLQASTGQQFVRGYLKLMMKTHQDAIETLSGARTRLREGPVLELINTMLPILEQHHDLAKALQREAPAVAQRAERGGTR